MVGILTHVLVEIGIRICDHLSKTRKHIQRRTELVRNLLDKLGLHARCFLGTGIGYQQLLVLLVQAGSRTTASEGINKEEHQKQHNHYQQYNYAHLVDLSLFFGNLRILLLHIIDGSQLSSLVTSFPHLSRIESVKNACSYGKGRVAMTCTQMGIEFLLNNTIQGLQIHLHPHPTYHNFNIIDITLSLLIAMTTIEI